MGNNLLSERLVYTGRSPVTTHIHICSYDKDGAVSGNGFSLDETLPYYRPGKMNFIQFHGLNDTVLLSEFCDHFGIGLLVRQDILNVNHPVKVEQHDNFNFIVGKLLSDDEDDTLELRHVCIVQGADFVIVFAEDDIELFSEVIKAIGNNAFKIRQRQSDYLVDVLLNSLVMSYVDKANVIKDQLEDVEERLLSLGNSDVDIQELQAYRKKYLQLKKVLMPLREQSSRLSSGENLLVHKVNRPFWNDVTDHLALAVQLVENIHETIASLVDLYLSNNDLRMNNIMKRLTIVSTIFIPLTFLAGIWGMNFTFMPELDWRYGYLMAWGLMLVVGVAIYIFFRKKKWY